MTDTIQKYSAGGIIVRGDAVLTIKWISQNTVEFPKGTVEDGESDEQTALREVKEETGYDTKITKDLGTVTYEFDWTDQKHYAKTVHFFLMELTSNDDPVKNLQPGEDFENSWLKIESVMDTLTHDDSKEIFLKALPYISPDSSSPHEPMRTNGLRNTSRLSPVIFIAIDGKGGAGKSTLAKQLAAKLNASIVSTDDFTTFDIPTYTGTHKVVEQIFKPIKHGTLSLSYKRLQVWPGEPREVINLPVTPIIILEGCGASCRLYRPYISYVIAVDLDDRTRIKRIIERDVVKGGRGEEENEVIGKLWEEKENEYFEDDNPLGRADLVVSSANEFAIDNILEIITKLR